MSIDFNFADRQRVDMPRPIEAPSDPVAAFVQKMAEYGLEPPEDLADDGSLHRFMTNGRKDSSAWYVFHGDGVPSGAFGDWAKGINETWCSRSPSEMSDREAETHRRRVQTAREARRAEEARNQAEAQRRAAERLRGAEEPDPEHPYLRAKGVTAAKGVKANGRGELLIPMRDADGVLWSVQEIKADGRKKFPFGSRVVGSSFTIEGSEVFAICEGYATGASIHEAIGATVVVAFNRTNLKPVAEAVRRKAPGAHVLICADNDQFTPGNPGMTDGEAAARAVEGHLCYPTFADLEGRPTDFNDLLRREGIGAVRDQIKTPGARTPFPPLTADRSRVKGRVTKAPPPIEFAFEIGDQGLIPRGVVGVICAAGGTGKTFWLLSLACGGAGGGSFGPIRAPKPLRTLILVAEDPQDEMDRRLWNIGAGSFPEELHAASIYGEVGPLMRLDGNVPVKADGYFWLEQTIQNHPGLELLILDPKSRLFGLNENDNDHCTQWIQMLEGLAKTHGLTILFSHHTSKDQADTISQNMGPGGSAIVDGCRWQAGLKRMDADMAQTYGIEDRRNYVVFDAPKSNYAPDMPAVVCFKRTSGGVLVHCDPWRDRMARIADATLAKIEADSVRYTRRELEREEKGKDLANEIKEEFPTLRRERDIGAAIDLLIEDGRLFEAPDENAGRGRTRMLLHPTNGGCSGGAE